MRNKGFTLIEMLVVIAIIGGLSALLLPNYMDVRSRGKDAQRKNDLKTLQKALEMYRQDQKAPTPPVFPTAIPASGTAWIGTSNNQYLGKMPSDPNGGSYPNGGAYEYTRSADGYGYTLCACLENGKDGSACAVDCPRMAGNNPVSCAANNCYIVRPE